MATITNTATTTTTPTTVTPYANNAEYLLDEMRRLDLLLRRQVIKFRGHRQRGTPQEFRGLVIADQDVDEWLDENDGNRADEDLLKELAGSLAALTDDIDSRVETALREGIALRLPHIAAAFGLNAGEVNAILVCLAPALDRRYQRIYGYLQDDVTQRRPTVDLALSLQCESVEEKISGLALFARDGLLRRHRLINTSPDPSDPGAPLLAQQIALDERITGFLLGQDRLDAGGSPSLSGRPSRSLLKT